jgi:ribosomal protein S18 acetylase RimI-like enzyme
VKFDFQRAILPGALAELLEFDCKIFGAFPSDLFEPEEWECFESYWMFADGAKVGCSAFQHNVDYDQTPKEACLYIASTGILPQYQGRGFGLKQKEWQILYARQHGFSNIVTNMRRSNTKIIRLNEKLGFRFRSIDAGYYADPTEDAVVMEKSVVA